jgi:ubiquinone/menaquinone biosynthesis C-methylase UbiE
MNFFNIIAPIYKYIHPGAKQTFEMVYKIGNFKKEDKLLDLGGGVGRIAKFFVGKVDDITVSDPSCGMIEKCRSISGLKCIVSPAEQLPLEDNYFDKIIIIDAMHHFNNLDKVFAEIKRVLKPGGIVIVEEINAKKIPAIAMMAIERFLGMNSNIYVARDLFSIFQKHGFEMSVYKEDKLFYYLAGGFKKIK